MVENRSSLFGIIALIIGASGLGLGVFSVVNFQIVEGPQGSPGQDGVDGTDGQDGQDGMDAPGGIVIGILTPSQEEVIFGNKTIKALIDGSDNYTVSILRNGTEIGDSLPLVWDTNSVDDGWWNITVKVLDVETADTHSDQVIVYVKNTPSIKIINPTQGETLYGNTSIEAIVSGTEDYTVSILRNGTEIGTSLPHLLDLTYIGRTRPGWQNITVIIRDGRNGKTCRDEVFVFTGGYEGYLPSVGGEVIGYWEANDPPDFLHGDIIAEVTVYGIRRISKYLAAYKVVAMCYMTDLYPEMNPHYDGWTTIIEEGGEGGDTIIPRIFCFPGTTAGVDIGDNSTTYDYEYFHYYVRYIHCNASFGTFWPY